MINQIVKWFEKVKPNPKAEDLSVQYGCHLEEIAEMLEAQMSSNFEIDLYKNINTLANLYKKKGYEGVKSNIETLDALCDQIVTATGVGCMMGFDMEGALQEVISSNNSKFENGNPLFDENGKVKKGVNYRAPDLKKFIGEKNGK